jgi:hypothetical protein
MDTWHTVGAASEPAFLNGWVITSGYPVQFRKDPLGKVQIRGMVAGGTVGTSVFLLPAGYRPAGGTMSMEFANIVNATAVCRTIVQADGNVVAYASNSNHSFANLEFDTDSVTQMPTGPQGPAGPESYAKGARSTDFPLPTGAETTVIYTTSSESVGTTAPTLNTATGIFTINETGEYTLTAAGYMGDNPTGRRIMLLRHSRLGVLAREGLANTGGNNPGAAPSVTLRCLAGDTVWTSVYQDSGATLQWMGASNPYMTVTKVAPGPQGATGAAGATGPPGVPLRSVGALPSPGTTGDMVLYTQPPATSPTVWFYDGASWQQVGTGSGGSRAFSFFMGGGDD